MPKTDRNWCNYKPPNHQISTPLCLSVHYIESMHQLAKGVANYVPINITIYSCLEVVLWAKLFTNLLYL